LAAEQNGVELKGLGGDLDRGREDRFAVAIQRSAPLVNGGAELSYPIVE
jgi:hypothetical protein